MEVRESFFNPKVARQNQDFTANQRLILPTHITVIITEPCVHYDATGEAQ